MQLGFSNRAEVARKKRKKSRPLKNVEKKNTQKKYAITWTRSIPLKEVFKNNRSMSKL